MLDAPCRRDVRFFVVFDRFESRAEFTVQGIRVVLDYRKTAALGGPSGAKVATITRPPGLTARIT
jgi:hypothetical protein